jgi:hypothetical protein
VDFKDEVVGDSTGEGVREDEGDMEAPNEMFLPGDRRTVQVIVISFSRCNVINICLECMCLSLPHFEISDF